MAIKKQVEFTPSLKTRLWNLLKGLLYYPHKVAKRYAAYNAAVGEMIIETNDGSLDPIRRRNSWLVNIFIYLPMTGGVAGSLFSMYFHRHDFVKYFEFITSPVKYTGFFSMIGKYIGRSIDIFSTLPFSSLDYQLFIWGYGLAIVFAYILSKHTSFKEEARIVHIFSTLGYIDSEGNPWKVTWTPNSIMITAFNCDPIALCANNRFWSSINFPPSPPKVFKNNMNKFVVQRKYELPAELTFHYKGDM
jgi:hypothetical protein